MSKEHKAVCIIAWPAGHSRSPLIHNYWIKQHNLNAEYRREAVPPEKFVDFVSNLRANGYVGANVTVPHKQAALKLSEPDDRARAVGAANALWYDDGKLRSTNTDVEGFLANLDAVDARMGSRPATAVVLGAGGGARAVIFALIAREVGRVYVINRTAARAKALQKKFGTRIQLPVGRKPPDCSAAPGFWSTPPRSAWSGSRRLNLICAARHLWWSRTWFMTRW